MEKPKYRRSKIFISSKFQFSFIIYSLLLSIVPIIVMSLTQGLAMTFEELPLHYFVFFSTSITILLLFTAAVLLSHRLAGPIYRIEKHLNEVANGSTRASIKLREKDYFTELADAANRVIQKLS